MRLPGPLMAISPGQLQTSEQFPAFMYALEQALGAGLPALLLREPSLNARDFLQLTRQVLRACESCPGTWCGVHDSPHIALEAGAQGVHLGFRSMRPALVREIVGDLLSIGYSAHAGDGESDWVGADYLTFGPVYPTPSKRGWLDPVGLGALAEFSDQASLPVLALGGLTPERAGLCGVQTSGVAVLSGILADPDPAAATGRYLAALQHLS